MEKEEKNQKMVDPGVLLKLLDVLYRKALTGIPGVSRSVEEMAELYREKAAAPERAAKSMLRRQIAKCTTAGVATGIGGVMTLPVSIPANVAGVLYIQLRMTACTACLAGYDLTNETVQAYIYAALAGIAPTATGRDLEEVRQLSARRLLEGAGEKGVLNLAKLFPGIGAGVNGAIDYSSAKAAANRAYAFFFEKILPLEDEKNLRTKGGELYRKFTGRSFSADARTAAEKGMQYAGSITASLAASLAGRKKKPYNVEEDLKRKEQSGNGCIAEDETDGTA